MWRTTFRAEEATLWACTVFLDPRWQEPAKEDQQHQSNSSNRSCTMNVR